MTTKVVERFYEKKLEGLEPTEELVRLWRDGYSKVQFKNTSDENGKVGTKLTRKEALRVLEENCHPNQNPKYVPIRVLQALEVLVDDPTELNRALRKATLVFTPPPPQKEETPEQRKFRVRMDRLKLQHEETKYVKLTNNIQKEAQDDITAKSMTYAASVGMNMIVAPISFGCFMYFFAGGIFDYFLGDEFSSRTAGGTDIKRVIVGVVSGVIMLFIEMLLFVIRTHEVERHVTKKKKKKKAVQPFSVYTKRGDSQTLPLDPRTQALLKKQK